MTDVPVNVDAEESSDIALYLQLREDARAYMVELLESLDDLDPEAAGIALAEQRLTETRHNLREAWVALANAAQGIVGEDDLSADRLTTRPQQTDPHSPSSSRSARTSAVKAARSARARSREKPSRPANSTTKTAHAAPVTKRNRKRVGHGAPSSSRSLRAA